MMIIIIIIIIFLFPEYHPLILLCISLQLLFPTSIMVYVCAHARWAGSPAHITARWTDVQATHNYQTWSVIA